MSKEQVPRTKNIAERTFVDISSIKHKSAGGAKFWALFMDDCGGFLIDRFLREKSKLARQGSMLTGKINDQQGNKLKLIRCDNTGENRNLEEICYKLGLGTKFEYTIVVTLQQNGRIERKFITLYGRVRSMMIDAGIKEDLRQKLWAEAANMCVDLTNLLVNNKHDKSSYQSFYKISKDLDYVNHLRQFGEIGFVLKRGNKIKSKISDRGK